MAGKPKILTKPQRLALSQTAWGNDNLTLKQRNFVEALVGPAAGSTKKAARMAGYAGTGQVLSVTAAQTLKKAHVQEAIAHALARRKLTPEWAKEALADAAQASMANFLSVDEDGRVYLDFTKAAANGAMGQIKEYTEDEVLDKNGQVKGTRRKLKLHDPIAARALLLKFHGLIKDTSGPSPDGFTQASEEMARAAPPPGTIPALPQQGPVQHRAGGPPKR